MRVQNYGISAEEYEALLASQGGLCAICRQPEVHKTRGGGVKNLSVDHDHETGAVRGLLCVRCNAGLGNFKDRIDILNQAIAYLAACTTPMFTIMRI